MTATDATEARLRESIASRHAAMLDDLRHAVDTPTGPGCGSGLDDLRRWFRGRLERLGATCELVPGDPREPWTAGQAAQGPVPPTLVARRTLDGPSLLLCGHLDTVHHADSPFRSFAISHDGRTITGPGCVDMKGGLVVALHALEALEHCGIRLSWTLLLNSDEETGSFHSAATLAREAARGHLAGLVFEPAMADGGLAVSRSGSGQFMIETFGKAGHVGRDFASCVSAVTALAKTLVAVGEWSDPSRGMIASVGPLEGGQATNIVPDHAAAWGNFRFVDDRAASELASRVDALATDASAMPRVAVQRCFNRPAKPLTPATERLAMAARDVAGSLGQSLPFGTTGGVCDGNNLQAAGLPTIDTLGVRGGGLHTTSEWVEATSLVERAQLVAVLMARLGRGGVTLA